MFDYFCAISFIRGNYKVCFAYIFICTHTHPFFVYSYLNNSSWVFRFQTTPPYKSLLSIRNVQKQGNSLKSVTISCQHRRMWHKQTTFAQYELNAVCIMSFEWEEFTLAIQLFWSFFDSDDSWVLWIFVSYSILTWTEWFFLIWFDESFSKTNCTSDEK